jgi:CheY-like chemotaxis protein
MELVDALPIAMVQLDDEKITFSNECFKRLYGDKKTIADAFKNYKNILDATKSNRTSYLVVTDLDGEKSNATVFTGDGKRYVLFQENHSKLDDLTRHICRAIKKSSDLVGQGTSMLRDTMLSVSQYDALKTFDKTQHDLIRLQNNIELSTAEHIRTTNLEIFNIKQLCENIKVIAESRQKSTISILIDKHVPILLYGNVKCFVDIMLNAIYECQDNITDDVANIELNISRKTRKQMSLETNNLISARNNGTIKSVEIIANVSCDIGNKHGAFVPNAITRAVNQRLCEITDSRIHLDVEDFYMFTLHFIAQKVTNLMDYVDLFEKTFDGKHIIILDSEPKRRLELLMKMTEWGLKADCCSQMEELDIVVKNNEYDAIITYETISPNILHNNHIPIVYSSDAAARFHQINDNGNEMKLDVAITTIAYPIKDHELITAMTNIFDRAPPAKPLSILVADDDINHVNELVKLLATTGQHTVHNVQDAKQFRKEIKRTFDFIMIDMHLQNDINSLLKTVKMNASKDAKIILLTTNDSNSYLIDTYKRKRYVDGVLRKPFRRSVITKLVSN